MVPNEPEGPTLADLRAYKQPNDTLNADAWRRDNIAGVERETREQRVAEAGELAALVKAPMATVISVTRTETDHPALHMPGRNRIERCMAFVKLTPRGKTLNHDELFREGVALNRSLLSGGT